MPNHLISMQKIRQVLRFYAQGKGTKSIGSLLSMSRNTVKKYLQLVQKLDQSYDELLSLSDSALSALFSVDEKPAVANQRWDDLEALLPGYCKRLQKVSVTCRLLHKEYLATHPDGYGRSHFGTYIQCHLDRSRPVMHLEHKAGEKIYIDFAGDKRSIVDQESGEIIPVEVFVSILPSRYEAIINDDFASFAEHYGFTVIPARAYKPKDKALVEGAVKLIYRSIYTKLDDRVFHDLSSLNAAIRVALEIHNNTPFSGRNYSRRDQFEEIERSCLGRLNPIRYELKKRYNVTVMKSGHVRLGEGAHYYSVPCAHIGKKVVLQYTGSVVDIYLHYEKIASHTRSLIRYRYTTNSDHQASCHQYVTDWNPEKFINEALAIHADVGAYIKRVLEEKTHPEQGYKSCSGILSFARRVGHQRLINACRWADSYGLYNYPAIEKILHNRQDEVSLETETVQEKVLPCHENIRGKEYYQ